MPQGGSSLPSQQIPMAVVGILMQGFLGGVEQIVLRQVYKVVGPLQQGGE